MTTRRTTRRQTTRARELRRQSTFPERLLWGALRGHRLDGHHFRRQYPVASYFVDFACPAVQLAVELDGMSHVGAGQRDDRRTATLAAQGWTVVRFTNDQVLEDCVVVAEAILGHVRELAANKAALLPTSPRGGGVPAAPLPTSPKGEGSE